MLLEKKNAVIYGAGGAVGGAIARAFAREGRESFLLVVLGLPSTPSPRRLLLSAARSRPLKLMHSMSKLSKSMPTPCSD